MTTIEQFASGEYLHIASDRLAVAFRRDRPMVAFFGIESGGRRRTHIEKNLLRPGTGGGLLRNGHAAAGAEPEEPGTVLPDGMSYRGYAGDGNTLCRCDLRMTDERTLTVRVVAVADAVQGRFFRIAFAPDMTPPSVWARPRSWASDREPMARSIQSPRTLSRDYTLPALVTLPEFGVVRVEASSPRVELTHSIVPDQTNVGLNHGWNNTNSMSARKAYHHGEFVLLFAAEMPLHEIELRLRVEGEITPRLPSCDLSGHRWDGLRRCWMNAFTLNPPTLSLGDNPILDGLGHLAIHWKSDMSVYTPELLPGLSLHDFFRNALELTFTEYTDGEGRMSGYGWENGGCNLIALHAYLSATNDWDFVRQHLRPVCRIIEYNLDKDEDDDGILEASFHGNHNTDGPKDSFNWWDILAFGYKDGYANLVYHQAFRRMRDVIAELGRADLADRIDRHLALARKNFHSTFYNPATGVYAGWISRDGRLHDYHFTFITAMAIIEELVPNENEGRAMLKRLIAKLQENGYGSFRYGVPGMATPVNEADRITWPPMADWGNYIHGGFCGVVAYFFLLALYRVGMRSWADHILFRMLETFEREPTHSGLHPGFGIGKSWDWRTRDGLPSGYNYLADNYVFLLAAIQGHFGVEPPTPTYPATEP